MGRRIPGPWPKEEETRFLETFLYRWPAFYVDELVEIEKEPVGLRARMDTMRELALSDLQRTSDDHPPHVSAGELLMATGSLGCLHMWIHHGCRWDEGWVGFGNRVHRADFKRIVDRGPALEMRCVETKSRVGKRRIVARFDFAFHQAGELVYQGDQTAMFLLETSLR